MSADGKLLCETLSKIEPIYKYAGLNLYENKNGKTLQLAIYIFNFLCLNMDTGCAINVFFHADVSNFTSLSYLAPCVLYTYLVNMKSIYFLIHEKLIHNLIDMLKKLEERINVDDKCEVMKSINADRTFLHRILKAFNVLYNILVLTFSAAPLFIAAITYYENGEALFILPYPSRYPFDAYDNRIYPFVYLHQVWTTVVAILFIRSKDYFFYTSCTYIKIQINLLQNKLKNILTPSNNFSRNPAPVISNAEFHSRLVDVVKWHQEIIRSVRMLDVIFAQSTLYNIVTSSLIICLVLFNVTIIKDVPLRISFIFFLASTFLQIYFLCYYGDIIAQSSIEVSDTVYNTDWYMANSSVGRHLLLMLVRSQKPCKLTAYGFVDINLKVFMRILSNAWSYFALLKSIYP